MYIYMYMCLHICTYILFCPEHVDGPAPVQESRRRKTLFNILEPENCVVSEQSLGGNNGFLSQTIRSPKRNRFSEQTLRSCSGRRWTSLCASATAALGAPLRAFHPHEYS